MATEFELKYRTDEKTMVAIIGAYPGMTRTEMVTVYYDTPSRSVSRRKWMLRCRQENELCLITLKTPLPDGSRGEWETPGRDPREAIDALCKLGCPEELRVLAEEGLEQVCGAGFLRLSKQLQLPGCRVELALDMGSLMGKAESEPFREVEIELKEGSRQAAETFAQELAQKFGLEPEMRSKAQRAFALARKEK